MEKNKTKQIFNPSRSGNTLTNNTTGKPERSVIKSNNKTNVGFQKYYESH